MNFSKQSPSKQWAALKLGGEPVAEVWFKPEGEPLALMFRIPQDSFQIPGMGERLTAENLLKAVGITPEDVESWRHGGVGYSALNGSNPELKNPLPQPPPDVTHLDIYVRLKPSPKANSKNQEPNSNKQAVLEFGSSNLVLLPRNESGEPEIASAKCQDAEARWKFILGLEATLDTLRISMEGLRAEMEASLKRTLTAEEKLNALAADVVQWNKAKSRIHYALPKAREFIHRAIWAKGTPERKRLDELFKNPIGGHISLPQIDKVLEELENLRKDLQVFSAHGVTVYQECKSISADVQASLRRLQSNAAARPSRRKGATGAKGKSF
jgi:uncharacterized protein YoxC